MKQAFTLIELLVVVLIIGILSAVALPQYQKAVEKSYAAEAFVLAKSIHQAQEIYKMENGNYARSFSDLSVAIPSVSEQKNPCGLVPLSGGDLAYTQNFTISLGTAAQKGDVIVIRNSGDNKCYGIGYIDGTMYCSEIQKPANAWHFCTTGLGGVLAIDGNNWKHYALP